MAAGSQHRCVFVGNIPYDATEEQLIQICEEVGPVVSFRLVLDRETGKPKGYGFCEYKDEETALSARRNLQGYEINGRQLRVDFAENDKNSDRNREQGRGGPGLTSNIDVQKPQGSTSVLGDSALHQPIGLPLAATAASVMAGALGGAQIASLLSNQNGIQNQSVSGLGNDPLTQYLAKMSRHQLNEILSGMKVLATQNKALAQQLLQGSPQLPKALFQAQIMLGMVSPQMLQVANIQQTSGSLKKPSFQDAMPDHKPMLPLHRSQPPLQKEAPVGVTTRPSHIPLANISQNLSVPQQSALPHVPIQFQVQQQLPSQDQLPLVGTLAGLSGVPKVPTMRSQTLGGSFQLQNLTSSQGLIPQIQPPLLQHSTPVGNATHPHMASSDTVLQQTIHPRPLTSQPSSSNYPLLPCGLETFPREARPSASPGLDSTWASGINKHPSVGTSSAEHTSIVGSTLEGIDRPSKLAKLHDGSASPQLLRGNTSTFKPLSSQSDSPASLSQSDKPAPQFPPEVESALLQQVMSLTPEQLSSLPKEQQEQVLQIQKALQQQVMNFKS